MVVFLNKNDFTLKEQVAKHYCSMVLNHFDWLFNVFTVRDLYIAFSTAVFLFFLCVWLYSVLHLKTNMQLFYALLLYHNKKPQVPILILYQLIFYAYLSCFTLLKKCVKSVTLFLCVQYNSGLTGSLIYISSIVSYLLCIYCVSMYF